MSYFRNNLARVYVTGGYSGFLGRNFMEGLSNRNVPCIGQLHYEGNGDLINKKQDWKIDFAESVIHCASFTGGAQTIKDNPERLAHDNLLMSANVLRAAALGGVKKFMFISSSAVYPDSSDPLMESQGFIGDPHPVFFGVGWMKRYIEKLAEFYYKQYGMHVLIVRPSNVYGKFMHFEDKRAHVIAALVRRFIEGNDLTVWGTPDVVRDFIYVDDFIYGALHIFSQFSDYEVVNVVGGKPVTMQQLVSCICDATDRDVSTITYDVTKPVTVPYRTLDGSYAKEKYGFESAISLEEGINQLVKWYKENNRS